MEGDFGFGDEGVFWPVHRDGNLAPSQTISLLAYLQVAVQHRLQIGDAT